MLLLLYLYWLMAFMFSNWFMIKFNLLALSIFWILEKLWLNSKRIMAWMIFNFHGRIAFMQVPWKWSVGGLTGRSWMTNHRRRPPCTRWGRAVLSILATLIACKLKQQIITKIQITLLCYHNISNLISIGVEQIYGWRHLMAEGKALSVTLRQLAVAFNWRTWHQWLQVNWNSK